MNGFMLQMKATSYLKAMHRAAELSGITVAHTNQHPFNSANLAPAAIAACRAGAIIAL
jgi:hypothetical protein